MTSNADIIARYEELEREAPEPAGPDFDAILDKVAEEFEESRSRVRRVMIDHWFCGTSG